MPSSRATAGPWKVWRTSRRPSMSGHGAKGAQKLSAMRFSPRSRRPQRTPLQGEATPGEVVPSRAGRPGPREARPGRRGGSEDRQVAGGHAEMLARQGVELAALLDQEDEAV